MERSSTAIYLAPVQKIFREWLREGELSHEPLSVHGKGEAGGKPPRQEGLLNFMRRIFHIFFRWSGRRPKLFKKAFLLSLWVEGYDLPPRKIFPFFPFLEKGKEERGDLVVEQLRRPPVPFGKKIQNFLRRSSRRLSRKKGAFRKFGSYWKENPSSTSFVENRSSLPC